MAVNTGKKASSIFLLTAQILLVSAGTAFAQAGGFTLYEYWNYNGNTYTAPAFVFGRCVNLPASFDNLAVSVKFAWTRLRRDARLSFYDGAGCTGTTLNLPRPSYDSPSLDPYWVSRISSFKWTQTSVPFTNAGQVLNTPYASDGSGDAYYLSSHNIVCSGLKSTLSGFGLEKDADDSTGVRYKFGCAAGWGTPRVYSTALTLGAPGTGKGRTNYLNRHNVNCPSNNTVLSQFHLISGYLDCAPWDSGCRTKMQYRYTCITLPTATYTCGDYYTPYRVSGNWDLGALSTLNVNCGMGGLKGFQLQTTRTTMRYKFTCCWA
eukprot:TRINITY_DN22872_c0_g1_i1.p1 TRINITY_DN22872_c0_g1~~TRINITY_DN22872_c0_g1_i1.p1  ORF type:complete len:320 (+),score=36.26 TRINITY_DN22872_c0_g1_i1:122-1081(+)